MLEKNFIAIYYYTDTMIGQECLIRSTYPATMSDVFQDFTKRKRMYILFIILSIINAFIRDNSVDA